jgi:SAM-dependent methyltransferase
MHDLLRCPIYREPLERRSPTEYAGRGHGEVYPIVDGIPILLPDPADRARVARTDWSMGGDPTPLDFYNQTRDHDAYCRDTLEAARADVERWLGEAEAEGPVVEIGSGKGALQGLGGDYIAIDYSFTALRRYINPKLGRVCATACRLPLPDRSVRFLFTVASLEHVPEADLAFDEIHRVLNRGGVAYLLPAWHCVQYNCEGIPVRPYADLTLRQKLIKASLPIRQSLVVKAAGALPRRLLRRALWARRRGPTLFQFDPLRPDYERFWMSDSDAAARLDAHEGCLYFHSRGYEIRRPGPGAVSQLLARHEPVIVKKPR